MQTAVARGTHRLAEAVIAFASATAALHQTRSRANELAATAVMEMKNLLLPWFHSVAKRVPIHWEGNQGGNVRYFPREVVVVVDAFCDPDPGDLFWAGEKLAMDYDGKLLLFRRRGFIPQKWWRVGIHDIDPSSAIARFGVNKIAEGFAEALGEATSYIDVGLDFEKDRLSEVLDLLGASQGH